MTVEREAGYVPGRRNIIKRPRLTRLLDESTAKIIMLVAPAGYGKTTLAREWLEDKPHAWYQGTPASADVAALALGIAEAASTIAPLAGDELRDCLRMNRAPKLSGVELADFLLNDLPPWPTDSWLAIDDYHFAMEASSAESFLGQLAHDGRLSLLFTSRRRPTWASARRILYGEIHEVGQNTLAMTEEEASLILGHREGAKPRGLVALAAGWPAVIGLASLTSDPLMPDGDLPTALYDYFAEELYQAAPASMRPRLFQLAIAPSIDLPLARMLFDDAADEVLGEATRLGFLAPHPSDTYDVHPLLREFLSKKLRREDPAFMRRAVANVATFLIGNQAWDDAFLLVQSTSDAGLLLEIIEAGLRTMLAEGRLATIGHWLEYAGTLRIDSAVLDYAAAEVAFRHGETRRAESLALRAASRIRPEHDLAARIFLLAGGAAHRADRDEVALPLMVSALEHAQTNEEKWQALWGQYMCSASLERSEAGRLLEELLAFRADSPDLLLRKALAPAHYGTRYGSLRGTLEPLEAASHLVERARDPIARSSFLNGYAHRLALAARYEDARVVIDREIEEARTSRLTFALATGYWTKAFIELGLRRFGAARKLVNQAHRTADNLLEEVHTAMNISALRARLALAQHAYPEALAATDGRWERRPERAMYGEYLATRALCLACAGRAPEALELAANATEVTKGVEAAVLSAFARVIVVLKQDEDEGAAEARLAFSLVEKTENFDGFVCAYRAFPPILDHLAKVEELTHLLSVILSQARDVPMARRVGLKILDDTPRDRQLSPREREVYALLAQGMTNRQIASSLFISESTTKVHVRRILEKLRVRSRTEAALMAQSDED